LEVKFYKLGEEYGTIEWDGKSFRCNPPTLYRILDESVLIADGTSISARDEPEAFMRELYRCYKSPYFYAGEAVNSS
jgi:hypothetical protein